MAKTRKRSRARKKATVAPAPKPPPRPITSPPHADAFTMSGGLAPDPINMLSVHAPKPCMDQEPAGERLAARVKARLDYIRDNGIFVRHDQGD